MGAIFSQIHGVYDGYLSKAIACTPAITLDSIMINNAFEDLSAIVKGAIPSMRADWQSLTAKEAKQLMLQESHCTFVARFTPDMMDVIMAHNTWANYSTMNRVFKLYSFPDPQDDSA